MTARVFHIRSSFFIRFGLFVRLIPDGQIRSQNFVLIIFPRKFGPISARGIVYILIFYWDFSNNFDHKSGRYFWLFSTSVMIEPGKEPSKIYEQKK